MVVIGLITMGVVMKWYTGIGSRNTPQDILCLMEKAGAALRERGFILRSGGAQGADTAFEKGAKDMAEIYLPWKGFNGHPSQMYRVTPEAMGEMYSLGFNPQTPGVQKLFGRSVYQVLGYNLNTPSDAVVYWAPEDGRGTVTGGTRVAVYIARKYGIPCINLYFDIHREYLIDELGLNK